MTAVGEGTGERAADDAPALGSVVEVRDETWLVTQTERASDGWFVTVQGLSELVRGASAIFSTALNAVCQLDPEEATVRAMVDATGDRTTQDHPDGAHEEDS